MHGRAGAGGGAHSTAGPVAAGPAAALARVRRWPPVLREIALVLVLYVGYSMSRLVVDTGPADALENGLRLLAWERQVGLDVEKALVDWLLVSPALSIGAGYIYATLHYTVTPAVLVWLYRTSPVRYRQARTVLAGATVAALVGFWLYPTAPPRLLPTGYPDVLALFADWGWWGADASAPQGLGGLTNEYAAMPSMHVGWAVWSGIALVLFARRPVVRVLGAAYPVLITLVVVATANHYLVDAFAGAAVVVAVGVLAALLPRARAAVPRREPQPAVQLMEPVHVPKPRAGQAGCTAESAASKNASSSCMARR